MLVGKSFRLPALMSAVYELGLNFQKWMNESSLLFSSYSYVKKQDGQVVKRKHVCSVCCLYCEIKLPHLFLVLLGICVNSEPVLMEALGFFSYLLVILFITGSQV